MDIDKLFTDKIRIKTFERQLLADMDTPVSSYFKMNGGTNSFLLESMEGTGAISRYSIIGLKPILILKRISEQTEIIEPNTNKKILLTGNPFDHIKMLLKSFCFDQQQNFECGVLCGYLSYDTIRYIEDIPAQTIDDLKLPDIYLILPSEVVLFDNFNHTIKLIVHLEENENQTDVGKIAEQRLKAMIEQFSRHASLIKEMKKDEIEFQQEIKTKTSKEDFEASVMRAKEYIRQGDIFQVVLSRRCQTEINCDAFDIYRMLHIINPSPYMYYLNFGEFKIVGCSPEIMVRYDGNRVSVRPIAGTRRRGKCIKEDQELAEELIKDEKELAEHVMLVDLGRNDIGRVARYGSVRLDSFKQIENYSHVMHIVSTVSGKLSQDHDAVDLFKACFPAGTVSGAPKVRAMEIIDELEKTQRGPYAGAVGYFDFQGRMDTCITIRTIVVKEKTAYWQAGAGIVADSIPEYEYKETQNKARALLKAISLAEEICYDHRD